MSNDDDDVTKHLSSAVATGVLSAQTSTLITGNLGAIVLAGAAGKALEDLTASDVTLVTLLIDASGSIADRGLEQAVRDGQNALLDAFGGAKEKDSVLLALWTFNGDQKVLHAYVPVEDATRLDGKSYRAGGATRLYDTWCDALAANVAYAQRLRDGGTPTRSVVVVVTDGEDVGSTRTSRDCARLSKDLLASELFTLAFVGVGKDTQFELIAAAMGVPAGCVHVQRDATPSGLRKTFQLVSRSAIRASQGKVAPGVNAGFFTP
ncbi:MAG: VWA domain-containing protein [Myxococcus sp.]|nr:VWA domain-containing protein [Myxococcus sp.]